MPTRDELTARLRARDRAAVYEYATTRRAQLLAYIDGRLGAALRGKVEAEDILQEALVTAWQYLPTTDLTARDPFGWLCDLADRRATDAARRFAAGKRAAVHEEPLAGSVAGEQTTPSVAAARAEEYEELRKATADLPTEAREAVRMRFEDGLPTQQIASRMRKSDGAVRVLLSRAIATLRRVLGRRDGTNSE